MADAAAAVSPTASPPSQPENSPLESSPRKGDNALGSLEELTKEVQCLKAALDNPSASENQLLEALKKLSSYNGLPTKVLSDTGIGKSVNQIAKVSPLEVVRTSALALVQDWRQTHRKRKATAGVETGMKRSSSTLSVDTDFGSDRTQSVSTGDGRLQRTLSNASQDETLTWRPSQDEETGALTEKGAESVVISSGDAATKLTPQREKVRQKFLEAFGKEEQIENIAGSAANDDMRDPVIVSAEMEEELHTHLGDNFKEYMSQARAILFNLKDKKNQSFRIKLLFGYFKPGEIHKLSAEDMASDAKNAERDRVRKYSMAEIQSDWAIKNGAANICGLFTCGKCKHTKTTYFQMQTRSSDEPMTTFVTCLNCNNRWKFC